MNQKVTSVSVVRRIGLVLVVPDVVVLILMSENIISSGKLKLVGNSRLCPNHWRKLMEEWKEIEGFNGQYSVSSRGEVRSNYRWYFNSLKVRELEMMPTKSKQGYLRIKLSDRKLYPVHRLVASAFIENQENKPFVNHKNGNKSDNSIENLEWVTTKENNQHAWDSGLQTPDHIIKRCAKVWWFISPNQEVTEIYNLSLFCRENNLTTTLMQHVQKGLQKHHKGWRKYEQPI